MADANYDLTKSPLIDAIKKIQIGEKQANPNKKKGTVKDVRIVDGEIHFVMELGGIVDSPWSMVIEIEDGDNTFETVPKAIKGKIPNRGTSKTDRMVKLKKKDDSAA